MLTSEEHVALEQQRHDLSRVHLCEPLQKAPDDCMKLASPSSMQVRQDVEQHEADRYGCECMMTFEWSLQPACRQRKAGLQVC